MVSLPVCIERHTEMLIHAGTANDLGDEDDYSNISVFQGIQQYVDF